MIELTVSEPTAIELEVVEAAIKPEVTGHVTPTYEEQTVYPAAGTTFGRVEVDPIPDPTAVKEIGSNGDHDVRRYGTARVDVQPTLQSKTATPTEQAQTVLPDTGYDGLESVNIARIPTEYIVPTGTKNISQNGTESVREYDSVDVSVEPTLQDKTVTPTKQTQTVNADSGYDGLDTVQVDPIPSEYIIPTGKVTITQNGTFDVSQFAEAEVDVSPIGERGFYFTDFDAGRPHTLIIQGYIDGNTSFYYTFKTAANNPFNSVQTLKIKNCNGNCVFFGNNPTINRIEVYGDNSYSFGVNQASHCANLMSVVCYCNITNISPDALRQTTTPTLQLLDLSHNIQICALGALNAISPAEGCIIRVPAALLSDWQNATNWNALTGVVWEGV